MPRNAATWQEPEQKQHDGAREGCRSARDRYKIMEATERPDTSTSIEELARRRGGADKTRGKADRLPKRPALPHELQAGKSDKVN